MTSLVTAVYENGIFKPLGKVNLKEHAKVRLVIKEKSTQDYEVTVMSETSLKKDWLKPKEDDAWKDL